MCTEFIFQLIWIIGVTFYMHETTMSFNGNHEEKIRITYKAEDEGLHTYAIFRKDTHIKYLCEIILCQKNIYRIGCHHLML